MNCCRKEVTGFWLLVSGFWLLVTGYWFQVPGFRQRQERIKPFYAELKSDRENLAELLTGN
jgi:hypothetical protein